MPDIALFTQFRALFFIILICFCLPLHIEIARLEEANSSPDRVGRKVNFMSTLEIIRKDLGLMACNNAGFDTGVSNIDLWYEVYLCCHEELRFPLCDEAIDDLHAFMRLADELNWEVA